jgi:siroheme synthase (precorrin-2 oxidase/ferrochelatase)
VPFLRLGTKRVVLLIGGGGLALLRAATLKRYFSDLDTASEPSAPAANRGDRDSAQVAFDRIRTAMSVWTPVKSWVGLQKIALQAFALSLHIFNLEMASGPSPSATIQGR